MSSTQIPSSVTMTEQILQLALQRIPETQDRLWNHKDIMGPLEGGPTPFQRAVAMRVLLWEEFTVDTIVDVESFLSRFSAQILWESGSIKLVITTVGGHKGE